jgi:hypothetical protein
MTVQAILSLGKGTTLMQHIVSRPSYLFSGLVTQSEITTLLTRLHGSYGERLIASYETRAKEATTTWSYQLGDAFGEDRDIVA